jgi:photosystem II stability/assembly factor-like uncharacterized protein
MARKAASSHSSKAAGPRKKDLSKGPPKPRLSRHKKRSVWFQARASWPFREAPVHLLVRERNRAKAMLPAAAAAQWESVGPTNIGGRMTSIICHPQNPDLIWAGAAGGGVWQSDDAGKTWRAIWRDQDILNIGSLAIDPAKPDVLYCGTGEANLSADSYPGVGLYRSTDGGASWALLAPSSTTGLPTRIGTIAVNPYDSNHLCVGGVGAFEASQLPNDFGGLYMSTDGGASWKRQPFVSANNYWCHAIVFDRVNRGVIFATVTEKGARSGIWMSRDGGATWSQCLKGLPPPEAFGRTSLALAPSDPKVVYAFAESEESAQSDLLLGVFRSADGGKSWTEIGGDHFAKEGQISYGNTIAVHPKDPDRVICGGVDLHLTTDAGKTWKKVTRWDADRGQPHYAHADHHHLLIPEAAPDRIYDPNDGGLDVSDDGGLSWTNRSNGLAVTMYYDMDVSQSDPRQFGGGAQDNGTLVTETGRSDDFFEILGGDGGWMIYDPATADHLYASYYNMGIFRWRSGKWTDVSPPASKAEAGSVWMVYIAMDPHDSRTVVTGSQRVWLTRNDGALWKPVSSVLDGSPISAIEISEADSKRIYVGTENGGFFRSKDGGKSWSSNLASADLPGHAITRIDSTRKLGVNCVYLTVANFGHSHLFRSLDGGKSWQDMDGGQLPNVPHHAVVIHPDNPTTVYVGNDAGVFVSTDAGVSWMNMTSNLPNATVIDLVLQKKESALYAATYGRSLWRARL